MAKYNLVMFDFDGTLADTFPWVLSLLSHAVEKFNLKPVDLGEIEFLRGMDTHSMLKRYNISFWKLLTMTRFFRKQMERQVEHLSLFNGIEEIITQLAAEGVTLGVVTSNSYHNVVNVLGERCANLIHHFECGVSLYGKHKKFRRILKKSKYAPGEALYIGDEIRDLLSARKAKIDFGAVAWGYTRLDALQAYQPELVFHQVSDLEQIVASA